MQTPGVIQDWRGGLLDMRPVAQAEQGDVLGGMTLEFAATPLDDAQILLAQQLRGLGL